MMNDLISRAAAIKKLKSLLYETDFNSAGQHRDSTLYADIADNRIEIWLNLIPAVDAAPVVRCAYCKHCFDMGSDPMEPYDGESEWYCERFDRDTSAYEIDPYRFFCADGERRESE